MEQTTKTKRAYPSAAQKSRLIAILENDDELRRGKFSASFTKKEGERRWNSIAEELNSMGGSKRDWKEWRKTWQDMRSAAKKKNAACRLSATATGGGPPAPPLSEENVAVLRSISSNALNGHADCNESLVNFQGRTYGFEADGIIVLDKEDHPKTRPTSSSSSIIEIDTTEMVVEVHEDHSYFPKPAAKGAGMALHQDLPNSVSPMDETRTDQVPEVTANSAKGDKIGSNKDKENQKNKAGTKRRAAVRRLEESLAMGETTQKLMREKIELKREFYESLITALRAQTEVLNKICDKL